MSAPVRRQRDEGGSREVGAAAPLPSFASIAAAPQPAPNKIDGLFGALCGTLDRWSQHQQEQQQSQNSASSIQSNNALSKTDRKKLLTMLSQYIDQVHTSATNTTTSSTVDATTTTSVTTSTSSSSSPPSFDLELKLAQLEQHLQRARAFLRPHVLHQYKLQQRSLSNNNKRDNIADPKNAASAMMSEFFPLRVTQSSKGTTADDDNDSENLVTAHAKQLIAYWRSQHSGSAAPPLPRTFDLETHPTFEADAFLFGEEDDIDMLEDKKYLAREFCACCGRCDGIDKTSLISHSFSIPGLKYLCSVLFQEAVTRFASIAGDNDSSSSSSSSSSTLFNVVDVGSRLGIVPAAIQRWIALIQPAFSVAITGVEIDAGHCRLQRQLFHRLSKSPTATATSPANQAPVMHVAQEDVTSDRGLELLSTANFFVMNNVFEFFANEDPFREYDAWKKVLTAAGSAASKKKCCLVAVPSLAESMTALAGRLMSAVHHQHQQQPNNATAPSDDGDNKVFPEEMLCFLKTKKRSSSGNEERAPTWFSRWEQTFIDPKRIRRIADLCVVSAPDGGDSESDDDDEDDDKNSAATDSGGDADGVSGGHGDSMSGEREEKLSELIEDFSEMSLYFCSE